MLWVTASIRRIVVLNRKSCIHTDSPPWPPHASTPTIGHRSDTLEHRKKKPILPCLVSGPLVAAFGKEGLRVALFLAAKGSAEGDGIDHYFQ